MKIYTKAGDQGKTGMLGKSKVSKTASSIEAYGTVDELNSNIGLLISIMDNLQEREITNFLEKIQIELFDLGSELACYDEKSLQMLPRRLENHYIQEIERQIDSMTEELAPLKAFILPGGTRQASQAQVCRSVSRRAERRIIAADNALAVHISYMNRLSDYFFTLARFLNFKAGQGETLWR